mgnify:CR=1 FL=1
MTAKVLPKKTVTAGKVPSTTDLDLGEIAINYEDGVLYGRHPNGTIVNLTGALELHNHSISQVTGLQTALDGKVDDSQVLTNVPSGAVFTDTTYSAGNGISLSGTTFTVAGGDGITQQASGLAVDSTVIRTSGDQSMSGTKTFTTALAVTGTAKAAGRFYAGTTDPTNTTRTNYDGHLHAKAFGTGRFQMEYNPDTESLDFNYV